MPIQKKDFKDTDLAKALLENAEKGLMEIQEHCNDKTVDISKPSKMVLEVVFDSSPDRVGQTFVVNRRMTKAPHRKSSGFLYTSVVAGKLNVSERVEEQAVLGFVGDASQDEGQEQPPERKVEVV